VFSNTRGVNSTEILELPDLVNQEGLELAYPNLIHYNKLKKGGHFAAWNSRSSSRRRFARVSDLCTKTAIAA
jgi:hypothetical protein